MAFRVCCSCKSPPGPSEGVISRFCKVTQLLGNVFGTENYFWSPISGETERWRIQIDPAPTGEYLLEGFRVEWVGPTTNGQRFNGVMSTTGLAPPHVDLFDDTVNFLYQNGGIIGSGDKQSSRWGGTFVPFTKPTDLLNNRVTFGGHSSTDAIRGISFGSPSFLYQVGMGEGIHQARIKYWRLIENGQIASDIMHGYSPSSRTLQVMYPIDDLNTGDWQCSTAGDFWAAIDDDPSGSISGSTDYIWTTEVNDAITFDLSDFEYTGGDNHVKILGRFQCVNASGAFVNGSSGLRFELLYEGVVIAFCQHQIVTLFSWPQYEFIFNDAREDIQGLSQANQTLFPASNYIPLDADPSKFRLRIRRMPGGQGIAIAALQVRSEPFDNYVRSGQHWTWPINLANRIPWRKNRRIGFDIWFEIDYQTGYGWQCELGRSVTNPNLYEGVSSDVAHGVIGFNTSFLPDFDFVRDAFQIKFLNGTWRPTQALDANSTDTITFRPSSVPVNASTDVAEGHRPYYQKSNVYLVVNQEVPEVSIRNVTINGIVRNLMRYLPEDTGHAVTNFKFRANNTLGDVYVNVQTPGGVWKYNRPTKFVLERPCQTSGTNSFTPQEYEDIEGFPTEIEVSIAKPPQTYTYTEDDTWTCPDHVISVTIECFGGGGGGGGVNEDADTSGGGGGGGGYSKYTNLTVTPGETYDITVGAGGTAGTIGGGNGGNGSATEFSYSGSALCKAFGGSGGQGESGGGFGSGGTGASTGTAIGTTKFTGGNGAAGNSAGGGGGTSGASSGNGTAATASTGATKTGAGSGGNGKTSTTPGSAGSPPGGGGGGGFAVAGVGSAGYAGGDGRLTLTY
jgi:hypothetical protein